MAEQPNPAPTSGEAWGHLLALFGGDDDSAAAEYERVRARLCDFFRFKGMSDPEGLADRTIDRVARKLATGETLEGGDPARYALGVARFIYLETVKAESRQRRSLADQPPADDDPADAERRLAALEQCLEKLARGDRELALRYHQGAGAARIAARKALAAELGCTVNSLRIRVHRTRERLERCVKRKLS